MSQSIPMPPTDNLYKFMAISGLLLVLTTIILYVTVRLEVRESWGNGIAVLKTRSDLGEVRLGQAIGPPSKLTDLEAERWKKYIANKISELKSQLSRLEKTGTEVDDYWSSIYKAEFLGPFLLGGIFTGVLLMGSGFYLWYSRLQKYQDKIIARQAEPGQDIVE